MRQQEDRSLATVELLGALAYGQLRAFETTARAVRHAPSAREADLVAGFAAREHEAYVLLRDRLLELTDLGAAVMDRQRGIFDAFFDQAPIEDWLGACAFFATGLPLAADFIHEIAPALDPDTAAVVVRALADRDAAERYAIERLNELVADEPEMLDAVRGLVADLLGRTLTGFQSALAETDALQILLDAGGEEEGETLVKRVAMTVLAGHRRRMHALGIEDLD